MLPNIFGIQGRSTRRLANIIGTTDTGARIVPGSMAETPPAADRVIDVREIEGEPFEDIMTALDELGEDESLRLTAAFEPVPLYGVLEGKGFEHETTESDDLFHVLIQSA